MRISDWSSDVCSFDLAGKVERGWLGVQIQAVTDELADALGLDSSRGALVAAVIEDTPAEAAGVETGDVILRRSEERSAGKEGGSKCRSRWSPYHSNKTTHT